MSDFSVLFGFQGVGLGQVTSRILSTFGPAERPGVHKLRQQRRPLCAPRAHLRRGGGGRPRDGGHGHALNGSSRGQWLGTIQGVSIKIHSHVTFLRK